MKKIFFAAVLTLLSATIFAQDNVGIGTLTPNAKALLDLTSTNKGLMVPRMTTAQRLAINPAGNADASLLVYDTGVNLFYYWNGTQWIPFPENGNNISLNYNSVTGVLELVDNGGTLITTIAPNTDSQTLTLNTTTNILSISGGNTVDLTPYVNTDNQNLTAATLTGTTLTISIQNGNPVSVDLSALLGTDNQTLTLAGTDLSISNGNTIDLSPFVNTDNQDLTSATLTGTNLTIEIQNGAPVTVDLSSLVGTDNQTLTLTGNNLSISNGNTIDLTQFLDNTDNQNLTSAVLTGTTLTVSIQNGNPVSVDLSSLIGTDNQNLTNATLVGNTLTIEIQNGNPVSVDLTALVGTDNQTLTLTGNNLSISNGNTIDLTQFLDNTDNQNLTSAVLTGTTLTVSIQNGNPVSVDLSSLIGTDNQNLTNATLVGNTLTIEIQNGNPVSVDLTALVGTDNQTLTLTGNNLSISNGNTVDLSSLAGDWKLLGNAGTNPTTNFLGTTDAQDLVFRTNNVERIRTLASNGNVGINTPTPQFRFQVNGDASVGFNNPVNTGTFPNYGNFLHLLGGPSGPTWGSDNSDPFWLARYNVASNVSQLRINIGDDPDVAAVQDMLNVGTTTGVATFTSRLSVLSTGNVGISTETPPHKLTIVDENNAPFGIYEYNNADGANIRGYRARGTIAAPGVIVSGDPIVRLSAFGYNGTTFVQRGQISIDAAENWGAANNGTRMVFRTTQNGTATAVERMRITDSGNVGIGTSNPNFMLHIHQDGNAFGVPAIQLTNNLTGTGPNDGARLASQGLDFWVDNRSNGNLLFATNAFERARITPSGFLGIATTTPQNRLDVNGAVAIGTFAGVNTAPANGLIVSGRVRIGVATANTIVPANADAAIITFDQSGGYARIGNINSDPGVGGIVPGSSFTAGVGALAVGMNRTGGRSNVDFWNTTSHNQAAANQIGDRGFNWRRYNQTGVEQLLMTLDGNGNLTIAGTNYLTSDGRLKNNVKSFDNNVLDKVLQLQPSYYNKTNSALDNGNHIFYANDESTIADFGFIAQEVYKIFPELVYKPANENTDLWAVDYARLSVMLTKALQEQQAIIEKLEKENGTLKAGASEVKNELDVLKAELELIKSFVFQRAGK